MTGIHKVIPMSYQYLTFMMTAKLDIANVVKGYGAG